MGTTSWYNIFLLPKLRTGNDRTIGLLPWYLFKSLFNDIRYNGPHFKTKSLWNDMIQVSYMDTCRCKIFIFFFFLSNFARLRLLNFISIFHFFPLKMGFIIYFLWQWKCSFVTLTVPFKFQIDFLPRVYDEKTYMGTLGGFVTKNRWWTKDICFDLQSVLWQRK